MTYSIPLGDRWSLWSWACLRGTGFPARWVLELASSELAAAADRVLDHDAEVARRRAALIAACKAPVDQLGDEAQRSVQRALKKLWQHKVPDLIAEPTAELARQALSAAVAQREELERALADDYNRANHVTSEALRRVSEDDRFRQALLWQNRAAMHAGAEWLLRQPVDAVDKETRKKQRLIASYLQRYCVKNDTIGFFGPVGWARLVDQPTLLAQRPGPSLLASRTVYFEYWAMDALAARLAEQPGMRPFIAPRRLPRYRIEGTTLHHPIERQTELPAEYAAVASRCDGQRTAREIARELATDPELGLTDETDVFAVLDELVGSQVITWTLELPTAGAHPDRHLAALLARIEDDELRQQAEAILAELDARRTAVAACRDAAQLDVELGAFETAFTLATHTESRRAHGQTYAGRTPLYEDCRRDLELELGRPFIDRLAAPLELLLDSARWYTYEIASRYRRELAAVYRRLRGEGPAVVDFLRFWQEVIALFPGANATGSITGEVRAELHRRWAEILAVDPAERTVQRRAASLAGDARQRFAAPGPGWPAARHHSPDLMIAAAGADALSRGEFRVVIGELHTGYSTVSAAVFLKEHPHSDELIAARDADLDRIGIAQVWSKAVTRADFYSLSSRDLDLEVGETRSARPPAQVIPVGELVIEERDGMLEIRTRDGARRFDVIEFLEHHLIAESFSAFTPLASAAWTPRVTIDDVVIARETWRIAPGELEWPDLKEAAARFSAARRWARSLGLPRWVFVKTPEEVKPVYVDFDSAIYVEMLAKQLRGASAVALSEMVPSVEDTWLVDADGVRYTAELRITAVDPERWRPERMPG